MTSSWREGERGEEGGRCGWWKSVEVDKKKSRMTNACQDEGVQAWRSVKCAGVRGVKCAGVRGVKCTGVRGVKCAGVRSVQV